jgi:hypothetical protein
MTTTTATASADVPNNSRGSTKRRWKHRSTHFAFWASLLLAMTIATINVSTIARERMVHLDEVASNMPRATAIAVETVETMHATDKQKTHFTLPKEILERQKQKILAKRAAIEKFTTFLETKPRAAAVWPLPKVQPTLGAKNDEQTLRTPHTEPLELGTTTTSSSSSTTTTSSTAKQSTGLYNISIGNYSQYYSPLTTPNLWDNSTILPAWLKEYFTWHEQQRSFLTADNWQNFRFLIPRACKGYKSGGMTDRIRPLPALLRLAAQTRRILFIHWQRPFSLEEFLLPPLGGLDWRVPFYMVSHVVRTDPVHKLEGIRKAASSSQKLVTIKYQSWNYGELWYKEETAQGEPSVYQAFQDIWRVVFTPSMPVAQRIQGSFHLMALVPGEFATAHIRALYAVNYRPEETIQAMAQNAMNCVSNLRPGGPFFVASDSSLAIAFSLSYGRMMNVTVVSAKHPKQRLHVDYRNESDTTVTPPDYYDGFVDLYLMAATRCAAVGLGGFARWGHLLGYNDSCVIHHSGRKSQVCEWMAASPGNTSTPGYPSEEERRSIQRQASMSELPRFPMPMLHL